MGKTSTSFKKGNKAAQGRKLVERELWHQVISEEDKLAIIESVKLKLLSSTKWTIPEQNLLQWAWDRMYGKALEQPQDNSIKVELHAPEAIIEKLKIK